MGQSEENGRRNILKIVMGKADISEFDTFVENWKSQGGDQILKEINEELSK